MNSSSPMKPIMRRDPLGETFEQIEPYWEADRAQPISLTLEERGGTSELVTTADEPISVLAWVRYPNISTHVTGHALAWTRRAVYVEWQNRGMHRIWVWASAVDRF
ncbi:hypothetical protein QN357_14605 [Cryobacterium sp. RTC2.1]|uniref:hypothetical protein n=1 Tax=Cryobacterium sp. RTC2.1 TaxID=3048634 RepID=UPI002B239FD6|nr:hypothetical protein [Cryobacterium sp. RTC2.1]MEB0004160.1 hypothetical protein [Cryobacterium sp. RTC2.1]